MTVQNYTKNGDTVGLGAQPTVPVILSGTTGSIGGGLLTVGLTATGTVAVSGAAVGDPVIASPSDGSLVSSLVALTATVTATDVVTVQLAAVATVTPAAKTYNVKVFKM
jgi:hypothetical protein